MGCGCEIAGYDSEKRKVTVHLPAESDLSDLSLGASVELVLKGKVIQARQSLKKEDWEDATGSIEVEIESVEMGGKTIWDDL